MERNLDLAMTLPRKIPSRSTPATLTRTSFSSKAVNRSTLLAKVEPGAVISGDETGELSDSEDEVDGAGELFVEIVYMMCRWLERRGGKEGVGRKERREGNMFATRRKDELRTDWPLYWGLFPRSFVTRSRQVINETAS